MTGHQNWEQPFPCPSSNLRRDVFSDSGFQNTQDWFIVRRPMGFCASSVPCDSDSKRGVLMRSVYRNWKHTKEKCNEHFFGSKGCKSDGGAGYKAHADSRYRAEKFIGCMAENTNIVIQKDSALRKRHENKHADPRVYCEDCDSIWKTKLGFTW